MPPHYNGNQLKFVRDLYLRNHRWDYILSLFNKVYPGHPVKDSANLRSAIRRRFGIKGARKVRSRMEDW